MTTTTFESVQIGDAVWDIQHGWGTVYAVIPNDDFPIKISFDSFEESYSYSGQAWAWIGSSTLSQTLFWGEVVIEAPVKPLPVLEVDTKVVVWRDGGHRSNRHFSHFDHRGVIHTFADGRTSFTGSGSTVPWLNWELAE